MNNAYTSFNTKNTPVSEPILGKKMIKNADGGGYVFEIDPFKQLERFLILGSEGGSFYVGEKTLTRDNAANVIKCIEADGKRAVDCIVEISDSGRALKNDPALFALALAASAEDSAVRSYALQNLARVARIPTHLFHFVSYALQFRGWGRGLKRAVANWYQDKEVDQLAYTIVKYQQRDGWSNADLLRLTHPKTLDVYRNHTYKWAVDGLKELEDQARAAEPNVDGGIVKLPSIIHAFEEAKEADPKRLVELIRKYNLSREMLPTEALNSPEVWEALLEKMPPHALLRNLGKLSAVGLLKSLSSTESFVADKLASEDAAKLYAKNRVHPIAIYIALKQYSMGHGLKGSLTWKPSARVIDSLNDAFYLAFKYAEPTGKRFLIGVDTSQSMSSQWGGKVSGLDMTAAEGASLMAMAVAKMEKNFHTICFDTEIYATPALSSKMRLDTVHKLTANLGGKATHLSLPIEYTIKEKLNVDTFLIITDNEVNTGRHAAKAIVDYRNKTGIRAKLIVVAMTATSYSILDQSDPYSLDVCGFDASVPQAIQEFARI